MSISPGGVNLSATPTIWPEIVYRDNEDIQPRRERLIYTTDQRENTTAAGGVATRAAAVARAAANSTGSMNNEYWIYINRSEALKKTHPDWPADKVAKQAEADFNKASQEYWTASLRLCKKLRPNGVWGWYNYPIDSWNATFTGLGWLYDEVTALFPSIYLTTTNATLNRQYVDIALNKTKRVRDLHRKGGTRALPTYAFVWLDYDMPPFPKSTAGLLSPEDVQTELVKGATRWALDGVILWGSSIDARNATYCAGSYTTYVDQVAGPALLAAAKAADECAAARCSSRASAAASGTVVSATWGMAGGIARSKHTRVVVKKDFSKGSQ